jgi:hypothetical protein
LWAKSTTELSRPTVLLNLVVQLNFVDQEHCQVHYFKEEPACHLPINTQQSTTNGLQPISNQQPVSSQSAISNQLLMGASQSAINSLPPANLQSAINY